MTIIFKPQAGYIFDFFFSFWLYHNTELLAERRDSHGFAKLSGFEKDLLARYEAELQQAAEIARYARDAAEPSLILPDRELFNFSSLDDFFQAILELDDQAILNHVNRIMSLIANGDGEATAQTDLNPQQLLDRLADLPINAAVKWELYLLLNQPKKYLTAMAESYLANRPLFESLSQARRDYLADFSRRMEELIQTDPAAFCRLFEEIYDLRQHDTIYVTTSAFLALQMSVDDEGSACVFIGPNSLLALHQSEDAQDLKEALVQLRNVSENSKFQILKYLAEGERYGQEIADELDLTKPTVSHHLYYLTSQNWVSIRQAGVRIYYTLQRDRLRRDITLAAATILRELGIEEES